jgi:signal peptidase II
MARALNAVLLLASAGGILALDQATKAVVMRFLPERPSLELPFGCRLQKAHNMTGAIIPIPRPLAVAVWLAGIAGVALILTFGAPTVGWSSAVGLGMAVGGATGNVVDRFLRDGVIDFIAVWRFPLFNLADAALVTGVLVSPWGLQ